MAKLNILKLSHLVPVRTYEGAPAKTISPELALRRSVMSCMLWEDEFYENGQTIAARIRELVPQVEASKVAAMAVEAREANKLRHVPLLLVREMARYATHRALVAETLARVIQRADELAEFVAIYWAEGRAPLSGQVKKGLAAAFPKFDEYALAKYDRDGAVRLRDVLFLCHAKPKDADQAGVWRRLVEGTLTVPDTWEVALSSGGDKRAHWERLLAERKLGALALLRNLRNMKSAGVREDAVQSALAAMKTERVLPFRFLAAARYAPQWEEWLEQAMIRALQNSEKLRGRTVLLVDVSGSMDAPLARRSDLMRMDAACGLAILLREVCEAVAVYSFSDKLVQVPARRGFALRDAIVSSQRHAGTELGSALRNLPEKYDRILVLTDEQSHDRVSAPRARGYMINVASARNGVGYGSWTHVDGWSESVVDYVRNVETTDN
jgi:60 kDa SS-A/Ro ribonucleoprotein